MYGKVIEVINGTLACLESATTQTEKDKWFNWVKGNIDMALTLDEMTAGEAEEYREYAEKYYRD